ncbi:MULTISPECIES: single-stranded DNA-binding protein [unclassified Leucobacter]|uniref:single-stranded DNA-binding protein n=1 Tax=unclassified Leucobacter TaxID=2621730 RepID=UPI0030179002
MADVFKVRIGRTDEGNARFFPKTDDKKAAFYVNVAENKRVQDRETGEWSDAPPRWYDAQFYGRDAVLLHEQYEQGDSLIVYGRAEKRVTEKDGREYESTRLYVDGFAPDPHADPVVIDRTARHARQQARAQSQGPTFEAVQDVDQEPAPAAPAATAPGGAGFGVEGELRARVLELQDAGRITQSQAEWVGVAWVGAQGDLDQAKHDVHAAIADFEPGAREYLATVVDQAGTGGEPKSWQEIANDIARQAPAVPASAVQQVAQARQDAQQMMAPASGPSM